MKNMIKRILVGVAVGLILTFLSGCSVVHASVAPYFNNLYFPSNLRVYNLTSSSNYSSVNFNRISMNDNNSTQFNYNAINWNGTFGTYGYAIGIQSDVAFVYDQNYSMTFYFGRNSNNMVNVSTNFTNYFTTHYGWGVGTQVEILNRIDNLCIDLGSQYNNIFYGYRYLCSYSVAFKAKSAGYYLFSAFKSASTGSFSESDFAFLGYSFNVLGSSLSSADIRSALANDFNTVNTNILNSTNSINNNLNTMKTEIKQKQQETTDAINEQTEFLKDPSIPSSSDYDFNSYNQDNGVITNLLTMPITLIQGMLNGMNNNCSAYNLGTIKGQVISLPCIYPGQHLGIAWNIIDVIMSGIFIFIFGKKCITIFNDVTNMKSNQVDEVFK